MVHFFRQILFFLAIFPFPFFLLMLIINPIMDKFGFVNLWTYGFYFNPDSNPIYIAVEIGHLLLSILLTLVIKFLLDLKLKSNIKYQNFTTFNSKKLVMAVVIVLIVFYPIYIILSILSLPVIDIRCGGGTSIPNAGCPIKTYFEIENFIIFLYLLYTVTFWVTGFFTNTKKSSTITQTKA